MLKLHRLRIFQLRSIEPCELVFHDGMNVLLGKNGSGKTTLLRLISALYSRPIAEILPDEEYELEVEFQLSKGAVTARIKCERKPLPSELRQMVLGGDEMRFALEIRVNLPPYRLLARKSVTDEGFSIEQQHPSEDAFVPFLQSQHTGLVELFRVLIPSNADGALERFQEESQDMRLPMRFDESLELLSILQKRRIGVRRYKNPSRPYVITLSDGAQPDGFWVAFRQIMNADPDTDRVMMNEADLGFLRRFVEMTGLRSARMTLERTERSVPDARESGAHSYFTRLRFAFTRRDGSEFPQEHLSYGQQRLLIFLYCQSTFPQVMIADELVNGLHHDWIEGCLELLRDNRQSFLSSQNPLLLDHLYFESQDEIQKTFLLCSAKHESDRDVVTWQNMSTTEAEVVHKAYVTGVQHVSELLHSLGLW